MTTHSDTYLREAGSILRRLRAQDIEALARGLARVRRAGGRVFALGVGGGAAHASHAVNDLRKLLAIEAYSPTDNSAELTARINDEGWETCFAEWLAASRLSRRDALLVFSVSGGDVRRRVSLNLVRAVSLARRQGAAVLAVTGPGGGAAAAAAAACVRIPSEHPARVTAHTEGFQALVWHLLVSHPALQRRPTRYEGARGRRLRPAP